MRTDVAVVGVAAAVPEPAAQRLVRAVLKRSSEYIFGFVHGEQPGR
jgi:hypothetical protein